MSGEEFHVMKTSAEGRRLVEQLARQSRAIRTPSPVTGVHELEAKDPVAQAGINGEQVREYLLGSPAGHVLIGPRYATASLPDDDYAGWHWKCSCGTEASPWIQNWPQSEDEARDEWRLHFE